MAHATPDPKVTEAAAAPRSRGSGDPRERGRFGGWTPWITSAVLHLGLIVAGMLVTWTVAVVAGREPSPVIVADFTNLTYEPMAQMEAAPIIADASVEAATDTPVPDPAPPETLEETLEFDPLTDAPAVTASPVVPSVTAVPAPAATAYAATFVGLSSSNARRIVYVIDASGSMIRTFPIVIDELRRSVDRLDASQSYGVIFFQRNGAVVAPPRGQLIAARPDVNAERMAWIKETIVPEGRSNPLSALEAAMDLKPDVIFLLSENITGSGEFEIDADELLRLVDRLNPRQRGGRRAVQINCIQFLEPDPQRTLERIAEEHGGERGYKLLDRAELGLIGGG